MMLIAGGVAIAVTHTAQVLAVKLVSTHSFEKDLW